MFAPLEETAFSLTKDGVSLNLSDMSPYDDSAPGIDISGNGVQLVLDHEKWDTHVRSIKIPTTGAFNDPTEITVSFLHKW